MSWFAWLNAKSSTVEVKALMEKVQSAKGLVDLTWHIGKAVVQAGYEKHQADEACANYLARYEKRHAQVKILGMSVPVPLTSIYTEVRVVPPEFLRGYRTKEEMHALFLSKDRSLAGYDLTQTTPQPGLAVVNRKKNNFLNVLGAPGAGKSTFLRYIGLMALQGYRRSTTGRVMRKASSLPYKYNILPVMLELRSLNIDKVTIADLVDDELRANGFPANFGRAALRAGALLVLLDGVDEIPADKLDETLRQIRDLVDGNPDCRFVTSCRTAFYKDFFQRFTDVLLTDFTDQQIQNLISNWFGSDRDQQHGTSEALWSLLADPQHRATRELARTPLLATFLCLVYDDRQTLPANRAELYGDALRILLERWAASKRVHGGPVFKDLSTKRELFLLEQIAGPAYEREQYFFSSNELANEIENFLKNDAGVTGEIDGRQILEEIECRQGLFVQRAHDRYSFSHLTLHEYLAASHYHNTNVERAVIGKRLVDERWREIFLLLSGLQEPDADSFLLTMALTAGSTLSFNSLHELASWAERIIEPAPNEQQTAGRRAAAISCVLHLALGVARDHALDDVLSKAVAFDASLGNSRNSFHDSKSYQQPPNDFGRQLTGVRVLARDLSFNTAHALNPELGLQRTYDLERERKCDTALDNVIGSSPHNDFDRHHAADRALSIATSHVLITERSFCETVGSDLVFPRTLSVRLSDELEVMNRVATDTKASWASMRVQVQRRRHLIQEILEIPISSRELPLADAELWVSYLISVSRILECREAAERVTKSGWDRVCARLFAPSKE